VGRQVFAGVQLLARGRATKPNWGGPFKQWKKKKRTEGEPTYEAGLGDEKPEGPVELRNFGWHEFSSEERKVLLQ